MTSIFFHSKNPFASDDLTILFDLQFVFVFPYATLDHVLKFLPYGLAP